MVRKSIAIILARGGSKRIPKKNILEFQGKPMIAWSIEAAKQSEVFEKVLVSTDDEDIASISLKYGAEVPFLRTSASDDLSSSSEATLAALEQAEIHWGKSFYNVAQLMANCPLRDSKVIKDSYNVFVDREDESQISCFKFGWMNPWWAFKLNSLGEDEKLFPEALKMRSQDLPELFCPTGAIWFSKTQVLKQHKTFYSPSHKFFPIDWLSAMDIDDFDDLEMAKAYYALKNNK